MWYSTFSLQMKVLYRMIKLIWVHLISFPSQAWTKHLLLWTILEKRKTFTCQRHERPNLACPLQYKGCWHWGNSAHIRIGSKYTHFLYFPQCIWKCLCSRIENLASGEISSDLYRTQKMISNLIWGTTLIIVSDSSWYTTQIHETNQGNA